MTKAPCYQCNDRKTGKEDCHGTCEKYLEYKEKFQKHKVDSSKYNRGCSRLFYSSDATAKRLSKKGQR